MRTPSCTAASPTPPIPPTGFAAPDDTRFFEPLAAAAAELQRAKGLNLLALASGWNPMAFIDLVEEARGRAASDKERFAVDVQLIEWQLLLDHCARAAGEILKKLLVAVDSGCRPAGPRRPAPVGAARSPIHARHSRDRCQHPDDERPHQPIEFTAVRAEAAGAVERIEVQRGQNVARGQLLLRLNPGRAPATLAGAEARIAQSQADLEALGNGGSAREVAQIEDALAAARASLSRTRRRGCARWSS